MNTLHSPHYTDVELVSAENFKIRIDTDGTKYYYDSSENIHRDNGPAVVCTNGDEFWYKSGKLHRIDGPAVMYANGAQYWFASGTFCHSFKLFQQFTDLSDEEIITLVLKYGQV